VGSVITLTTIGYGDVYPVTVLGKVFASVVAVAGIGLIAMPTGILASAFSKAVRDDAVADGKASGNPVVQFVESEDGLSAFANNPVLQRTV